MADEDDRATTEVSDDSSEADVSDSEPELMVATRERRKTAGNRYNSTVGQEQETIDEEDDVALLFAEGEEGEDEEYNSDDGEDDADMSSSDDDDQGPNAAGDDLEGEKEVENQAKAERQKKRKADLAMTTLAGIQKKKPKIDPTSLHRMPDRKKPSKRKERVSWLPGEGSTMGRTSLRKQTVAHREQTRAKMIVDEAQRKKMKARREQKERQKAADAPKELTQADRLAEAERTERRNAKSLNRWEATERKRQEEQAARLAALKERKLEGAVITYHSSSHKYKGLKREDSEPDEGSNEPKKRGRKSKIELLAMMRANETSQTPVDGTTVPATKPLDALDGTISKPSSQSQISFTTPQIPSNFAPVEAQKATVIQTEPQNIESDTHIHEDLPERHNKADTTQSTTAVETENEKPSDTPPIPEIEITSPQSEPDTTQPQNEQSETQTNQVAEDQHNSDKLEKIDIRQESVTSEEIGQLEADTQAETSQQESQVEQPSPPDASAPSVSSPKQQVTDIQDTEMQEQEPATELHLTQPATAEHDQTGLPDSAPDATGDMKPSPVVEPPPEPVIEVISTRNLMVLDKFDELPSKLKQDFSVFTASKKVGRHNKHVPEFCTISGLPAKYRDPATSVGYANAAAYKKLKELKQHQFSWSSMLGCYVGKTGVAARGVPEGFLG